jgi:hypothetical protein
MDDRPLDYVRADRGANFANATVSDHLGKSGVAILWFGLIGCVFGSLGLAFGIIALINTSAIVSIAGDAARAAAKAETATARANVSEIYAKQVYTELNRLGFAVRTPAEEHAPQPSDNVSPEAE